MSITAALGAYAAPLEMQDVVRFPDQAVAQGQEVNVALPALPARAGKVTVLTFRAVIASTGPGGCNYNGVVRLNGQPTSRHTSAGTERMIGRSPALELVAGRQGFPVFSGDKLMLMFAVDTNQGDTMTSDGMGATFNLDITDLARGVDGNTLTFQNIVPGKMQEGFGHMPVTDLAVGYLDRSKLPKTPSLAPQRGKISGGVKSGNLRLAQSRNGGFVLRCGDGPEVLVETALGMDAKVPAALLADDHAGATDGVQIKSSTVGTTGYAVIASWPSLQLERTLKLQDGRILWHERWTNRGAAALGVPFRHRFFLRDTSTGFYLGGSSDNCSLLSSASNPTLFLHPTGEGNGFGVTAENDWLRLYSAWSAMSDLGEIFSNWLALDPGKSIAFDLSLTPVNDGGGYWSFINDVRRRWGVNKTQMPAPMFWGYGRASGENQAEIIKKSLGHLGPIIVVIGPWQRLEPDARAVTNDRYPKLPPEAPRTPGLTPDLDVDAFLTFKHREPYWEQVKDVTRLIHENVPGAKVIQMIHPAMEAIYKPLQERWPIAPDAIEAKDGSTFEEPGYSRSWLGDMTAKDWGVLYYCPHDGGPQLQAILDGMRRGMDECELDGIYSDEFSWAFSRGYSRYDYSRSDGYTADLDEQGGVVARKCDNAIVSEPAQLQITGEVLKRGKFFLGNGGNVLASTFRLPIHRFVEGGNGPNHIGQGHLSAVPLVLGNFGDEETTRGVFEAVKLCLAHGSIYSPVAVNLLLEGDTNFVSKLYPLTIVELGAGYVIGKERIISSVTRSFDWPGADGRVKLFRYNSEGTRIDAEADATVSKGQKLSIMVPEGGIVVAELAH